MTLPIKSIRPDLDKFIFAPDVEEVRVSPVVARKGWLNFLDEKSNGWVRKWVVGYHLLSALSITLRQFVSLSVFEENVEVLS